MAARRNVPEIPDEELDAILEAGAAAPDVRAPEPTPLHHHHSQVNKRVGRAEVEAHVRLQTLRAPWFTTTAGECNVATGASPTNPSCQGRLGELVELGVLVYATPPIRKCRISGENVDCFRLRRPDEPRQERHRRRCKKCERLEQQLVEAGLRPCTWPADRPGGSIVLDETDETTDEHFFGGEIK